MTMAPTKRFAAPHAWRMVHTAAAFTPGRLAIVLMLLLCIPGLARAQYERPGSTAAQFLMIGTSARAAGMGEAYIAVAEGAESAHYNAANLGYLDGTDIVFNHTQWFAGINHEYVAVAHTLSPGIGTFALSVTALTTDEMSVRTPLQPEGTGETFYSSNTRFGLSYARMLTDRVSFGGTVHYVNMDLFADYAQSALAVDIATSYQSGFRGFRFGMKIANLGSEVKFINESYPLPTNFTFGATIDAVQQDMHRISVSGSAIKPNDSRPLGNVGAEYSFNDLLALRGGYFINHGVATFSFGGGLHLALSALDFRFDYGYSAFGELGTAHRFAVGLHL